MKKARKVDDKAGKDDISQSGSDDSDPGFDYEGDKNEAGYPHGQGLATYTNGDTYKGSWVDRKREGDGTYTYANKNTYEGQWADDEMHGGGVMTYAADGRKEKGEWVRGVSQGPTIQPAA